VPRGRRSDPLLPTVRRSDPSFSPRTPLAPPISHPSRRCDPSLSPRVRRSDPPAGSERPTRVGPWVGTSVACRPNPPSPPLPPTSSFTSPSHLSISPLHLTSPSHLSISPLPHLSSV
jgi:hypothetical protein